MNNLLMNVRDEAGMQIFSFSYEGICDNKFLVTFTEFLSASFDRIMTPPGI